MDDQSAGLSASVLARALSDADFKARLIDDPVATLRGEGIDLPAELSITVVENSPTHAYMVLPDATAVSDEILAAASGGFCAHIAHMIAAVQNNPLFQNNQSTEIS